MKGNILGLKKQLALQNTPCKITPEIFHTPLESRGFIDFALKIPTIIVVLGGIWQILIVPSVRISRSLILPFYLQKICVYNMGGGTHPFLGSYKVGWLEKTNKSSQYNKL